MIRALGQVPYALGLRVQEAARRQVQSGRFDGVLLALRHLPVVTLGRRARWSEVRVPRSYLKAVGSEFYYVQRGGGATYHDLGQAIVYPVLNLDRLKLGVPELLERTATAVCRLIERIGVTTVWDPERPGVYVPVSLDALEDDGFVEDEEDEGPRLHPDDPLNIARARNDPDRRPLEPRRPGDPTRARIVHYKIASIGLNVSEHITSHGIALNDGTPELLGFRWIDPCKSPGLPVTSLKVLLRGYNWFDPDGIEVQLAVAIRDMIVS